VSPNNPNQPNEGSSYGNVPPNESRGGADPLAGNPYSTQYQQAPTPDLDANAPQLRSNDLRRMNRRALLFLAAIVVLLLVVAFYMFSAGNKKETPKPREETVTVPEVPKSFPQPPPPRPQPIPLAPTPPPLPTASQMTPLPLPQEPQGPTLLERRMMTGESAAEGAGSQQSAAPQGPYGQGLGGIPGMPGGSQGSARPSLALPDVSNAQPLNDPDTVMLRGTYIRCVLETRIITDFPGFTSCVVTEPIYSFNGRRLLLPKGSKVMGKYETAPTGNRVAVIWDRIVTPTGIDVNMASPGVDNLGSAGHPGYLNSHWGSRIGSALLISMLSDAFKYEAAEHGPQNTTISNGVVTQTPFESNTAQTVQNLANQAVQRSANREPTVTINQGTVITIYVAKDVDFNAVLARF
jgi:type IV secretion system protein VirB10